MRPLTLEELPDPDRYMALRPALRDAVIAHKRERRIAVGDRVSLVFEDRETLRWQVLEMARVERIRDPRLLQQELDVYNELVPGEGELSATLFVEITELAEIRPELDRLIGLDEHVSLELGDGAEGEHVPARFDEKQLEEDRIAAVQYLRFRLSEPQAQRFADPAVLARLRIDHPNYRREVELAPAVRECLARGLFHEPEPLLRAGPGPATRHAEWLRSGRVRAGWPDPERPEHVVVEPVAPVASLLDAEAELVAELMDAVRTVAATLVDKHGACRVHLDVGGGASRLRIHVRAPAP